MSAHAQAELRGELSERRLKGRAHQAQAAGGLPSRLEPPEEHAGLRLRQVRVPAAPASERPLCGPNKKWNYK